MTDAIKNLTAVFAPITSLRDEVGALQFEVRQLRAERDTVSAQPLPTTEVLQALIAHIDSRRSLLTTVVSGVLMRRARTADFDPTYITRALLEDLAGGAGLDKAAIDTALHADLLKDVLTDAFAGLDRASWKPGLGLADRARKLEQIDQSIARIEGRLTEINTAANEAKLSL